MYKRERGDGFAIYIYVIYIYVLAYIQSLSLNMFFFFRRAKLTKNIINQREREKSAGLWFCFQKYHCP